jgi:hypothetical protein
MTEADVARRAAFWFVLWAAILLVTSHAVLAGPLRVDRELVVQVRNYARMTPAMLHRAMDEVAKLFRRIGISVIWIEGGNASNLVPRLHLIVLEREIPELREPGHLSLGAAPRTLETPGRVAYVFHGPIEFLSDVHAVDVALVLAHAIAHELAHLLLPPGHSPAGLMSPLWGARQLRAAVWRTLMFSPSESTLIRDALPVSQTAQASKAIAEAAR